ncbi:MAG: hypothetical protein J2P27_02655 [Actinobacteria bacterium]|nr:hypothetical protein [Actinomycetota bacterium]
MNIVSKVRQHARRSVVSAALIAAVAVVAPATTAHAYDNGRVLMSSTPSGMANYNWDICEDQNSLTVRIFLEDNKQCGGIDGVLGWTAITSYSSTDHLVEVCNYVSSFGNFSVRVDSNGNVIEYPAGTSCYKATKGYPIRKFRLVLRDPFGSPLGSPWAKPVV